MGRHFRVLLLVMGLFASACGLGPADQGPLRGSVDGEPCLEVQKAPPAELPLGAVVETPSDGRDHVLCEVAYATSPPTSGPHFPVWQNCGFYDQPVRDETAVHSLEHGAIWAAYDPELSSDDLAAIEAWVGSDPHLLASPYPGLANPIVLTAWTRQLAVEEISDPAVGDFENRYLASVSETAPEAGVRCTGGIGTGPSDVDDGYDDALGIFSTQ